MNTVSPLIGPPKLRSAAMDSLSSLTSKISISADEDAPPVAPAAAKNDSDMKDADSGSDSDDGPRYGGLRGRGSRYGFTENNSKTFAATGNPCLDFFFHIVPDTPKSLIKRLESAWKFDALTTLKLVCNLRGVRGTGKSDRESGYTAALWLHKHHPKTLASNLRALADFGYFKDLVEVLYRIVEGPDARKIAKEEWEKRKRLDQQRKSSIKQKKSLIKMKKSRDASLAEYAKRQLEHLMKSAEAGAAFLVDNEKAKALRKERQIGKAKKALEKYTYDQSYRALHDQVANVFAETLKSDIEFLNAGRANMITLASKWCPSLDSSFDKATLICESIARRVFPKEGDEYIALEDAHYVFQARNRLRKDILVPLRKALQLPEVYMSAQQWESLPYTRVASVAMRKYKSLFSKHDSERFDKYLEDVKSGESKIAAGALLPHQIIASLKDGEGDNGKVAELQWARMVDDLLQKGKLTNCMAVCDVSASMNGIPMEVSVALGLLVSELSADPWKGKVITFSEDPQLHKIEGDTLLAKTEFVRKMKWGCNTDFQKVFDRILEVAVKEKLREDEMIKTLFVFSDMEFDQASAPYGGYPSYYSRYNDSSDDDSNPGSGSEDSNSGSGSEDSNPGSGSEDSESSENDEKPKNDSKWETDYVVIQRKFKKHGYNKVPEIVFWNLRNSSATPVESEQSGVALLSGFSKNLLTMFVDRDGIVNPTDMMQLAISGDEYTKLVVVD